MSLSRRALALAVFIAAASAQWGLYGGGDGHGGSGTGKHNPRIFFNGNGDMGSRSGLFYPSGFGTFDLSKNYSRAAHARIAHAALASAAFVFFFPVGAMAVRVLPGRLGVIVHALCQMFAYLIFTIAFILGIWMALYVSNSEFHLIRLYHPVIGIVIWCLLFFQPLSGILHHRGFKRHGSRTGISYLHISFGRLLITFGMINGGLGLLLAANARRREKIAYGVIAGIMWVLWMAIAILGELRRSRRPVNVDGTKGSVAHRDVANGTNGMRSVGTNGTTTNGAAATTREQEKFA